MAQAYLLPWDFCEDDLSQPLLDCCYHWVRVLGQLVEPPDESSLARQRTQNPLLDLLHHYHLVQRHHVEK